MEHRKFTAYFDGASSGNPGPSGIGGVILDPDKQIACEISMPIGIATNNEAEYKALIAVAEQLVWMGVKNAVIKGDSQLVVQQVNGNWRINHSHLFDLCAKAEKVLADIPKWKLEWVPREKNSHADRLSSKVVAATNQPKNQFAGQLEQVTEDIFLAYGTGVYAVDTKHGACTCPAFTSKKTRPCKHMVAAEAFVQEMESARLSQSC